MTTQAEQALVLSEAAVLVRRLASVLDIAEPAAAVVAPADLVLWLRRVQLYRPSPEQERESRRMATRLERVMREGFGRPPDDVGRSASARLTPEEVRPAERTRRGAGV